ncbi:MAG TPA: TraB/GumN family protein [Caulobacteraceae bacterium]|nr:TraB/GumN family protein [Caulobacteraceae bacterium]
MRALIALIAAAFFAFAGQAFAKPPVWTVRDGDSTIMIFGSVHVLPQGLDWIPPELKQALAKADDVWFELPINPSTELESERLAQARGLLPEKDTLSAHMSPEQQQRLQRVADRLRVHAPALERMRPWLVEITLSVIADGQAGATVTDGVEQQLEALAPATARRRAFETPAQQIEFLAGASMADQVASLDQTLTELENEPDLYQKVLNDWMASDVAAIQARVLDPVRYASPTIFARLITTRNERWSRVIARRMAGSGETVIVVGMGHLVGPGGVPALLRAKGFTVEGP